jgi:hypothetical protein
MVASFQEALSSRHLQRLLLGKLLVCRVYLVLTITRSAKRFCVLPPSSPMVGKKKTRVTSSSPGTSRDPRSPFAHNAAASIPEAYLVEAMLRSDFYSPRTSQLQEAWRSLQQDRQRKRPDAIQGRRTFDEGSRTVYNPLHFALSQRGSILGIAHPW